MWSHSRRAVKLVNRGSWLRLECRCRSGGNFSDNWTALKPQTESTECVGGLFSEGKTSSPSLWLAWQDFEFHESLPATSAAHCADRKPLQKSGLPTNTASTRGLPSFLSFWPPLFSTLVSIFLFFGTLNLFPVTAAAIVQYINNIKGFWMLEKRKKRGRGG